jgi:hypothetical protein
LSRRKVAGVLDCGLLRKTRWFTLLPHVIMGRIKSPSRESDSWQILEEAHLREREREREREKEKERESKSEPILI